MIFKTFQSDLDGISNKIGFSKRSFAEWGKQVSTSFKESEGTINSFKNALKTAFSVATDKGIDWIKNQSGEIVNKENIDSYISQLTNEKASDLAQTIREQSIAVADAKDGWEDYFSQLKGKNQDYIVDLIKNTDDLSKLTGDDLIKANQAARESAIAHNNALKQQTLGAKAATIATKALSVALNVGVMWAISEVISTVATGLHDLATESERAKENADSFSSSVNSLNENIASDSSKLSDLNSKYQELSKGVNNLGENISLSTSEYDEYKNIISQVSDIMPGLTTYFNAQGEKIGFVKGKLADLNDEYKRTIQTKSKDLFYNGNEEGATVQDTIDNIENNKEYGKFESIWKTLKAGVAAIFGKTSEDTVPAEDTLNSTPYIYLSIDVRHGNFEVCDSNGFHIDEYTYDNVKQNKHNLTGKHNIKLHK